jgi:hypothetical protein
MACRIGVDFFRVVNPFDVRWDDPNIRPAAVKGVVRRLNWSSMSNRPVFGRVQGEGTDLFNSDKYRRARSFFTVGTAVSGSAPYCARCEWDQTTEPFSTGGACVSSPRGKLYNQSTKSSTGILVEYSAPEKGDS